VLNSLLTTFLIRLPFLLGLRSPVSPISLNYQKPNMAYQCAASLKRPRSKTREDSRGYPREVDSNIVKTPAKRPQPSAEPNLIGSSTSKKNWRAAYRWPRPGKNPCLHTAVISTTAELEAALNSIEEDRSAVFIAIAPWANADDWQTCLGDDCAREALVRDAVVNAYLVDVEAVPEATEFLRITTSTLPSAHVLHRDPAAAVTKRAEKTLHAPIDLVSLLCFEHVFGLAHLHRSVARAQAAGSDAGAHTTYVVVYSGATWCPPCCRIMPLVPTLVGELHADLRTKGVHVTYVKADRDASSAIDAVYDVKLIPTFQVFKAADVTAAHCADAAITALPVLNPLADHAEGDDDNTGGEWAAKLAAAKAAALQPLAALQNSQHALVKAFLERHTAPLSFDEDF
jgi:thiol-disulfide isomerase/thioredoxin